MESICPICKQSIKDDHPSVMVAAKAYHLGCVVDALEEAERSDEPMALGEITHHKDSRELAIGERMADAEELRASSLARLVEMLEPLVPAIQPLCDAIIAGSRGSTPVNQ